MNEAGEKASEKDELRKLIEDLRGAATHLKEEATKLNGFFKIIKRLTCAIASLVVVAVAYGLVILFFVRPSLVKENLDIFSLWHNIFLLLCPTIAYAFTVWAIVKIFQQE